MINKEYLIYFYKTTYVKRNYNVILIYNTLNHKSIYMKNDILCNMFKKVKNNTLAISKIEADSDEIKLLISRINSIEAGIFLQTKLTPFSFSNPVLFDDSIQSYHINEISIAVNSFDININDNKSSYQFQFLSYFHSTSERNISSKSIKEFLLKFPAIKQANIVGGNVFNNPELRTIISILEKMNVITAIYVNKNNIKDIIEFSHLVYYNVIVDNICEFENIYSQIENRGLNKIVNFVIILQTDKDIETFEKINKTKDMKNIIIRPFYNGNNLNFFQKHVFVSEDDLIKSHYNIKEFHRKWFINNYEFGKIFVDNDENVYCNINNPALCKMNCNTVVLLDKLKHDFFNVRRNNEDCKGCVFTEFCPSISGYDYVLKTNKICKLD